MYDAKTAAVQSIKAAFVTVIATSCYIILAGIDPIWILACMVSGIPLALVYGFLYGVILGIREDDGALTEEDEAEVRELLDEDEPSLGSVYVFEDGSLETEYSEEIVGTFKDTQIHEYIIVDHPEKPGEKLKCFFERTVHEDNFVPPEGWFVLLEPGILYVHADPENMSDEDSTEE